MTHLKRCGGFTLVELIVVIAILAILAGIALPAYTGYLNNAEVARDLTALSAVKTAAHAAMAATGQVERIIIETERGAVSGVTVYLAGQPDPVALYALGGKDEVITAHDFGSYLAAVPDLPRFPDGAAWTTADGWAVPTP